MNISKRRLNSVGKFLTFLLRHEPEAADLEMNREAWVNIGQLLTNTAKDKFAITDDELKEIVKYDGKSRFAFRNTGDGFRLGDIRCQQGHNKRLNIKIDYPQIVPDGVLYHGVPEDLVDTVMKEGLKPMSRTHVHITNDPETARTVAKRHGNPVVLQIMAKEMHEDGYRVYVAGNGVLLADYVPAKYLKPMPFLNDEGILSVHANLSAPNQVKSVIA